MLPDDCQEVMILQIVTDHLKTKEPDALLNREHPVMFITLETGGQGYLIPSHSLERVTQATASGR